MGRYRNKQVLVEAVQYDGYRTGELHELCGDKFMEPVESGHAPFVRTIEGDVTVYEWDYVVKYANGDLCVMRADEFEKTFSEVGFEVGLDFSEALRILKDGGCIGRGCWFDPDLFVFKQVPAEIPPEIVQKMQSLPERAKEAVAQYEMPLRYVDQCCICNRKTGKVTSWVPSCEDIFAEDWYRVR